MIIIAQEQTTHSIIAIERSNAIQAHAVPNFERVATRRHKSSRVRAETKRAHISSMRWHRHRVDHGRRLCIIHLLVHLN